MKASTAICAFKCNLLPKPQWMCRSRESKRDKRGGKERADPVITTGITTDFRTTQQNLSEQISANQSSCTLSVHVCVQTLSCTELISVL